MISLVQNCPAGDRPRVSAPWETCRDRTHLRLDRLDAMYTARKCTRLPSNSYNPAPDHCTTPSHVERSGRTQVEDRQARPTSPSAHRWSRPDARSARRIRCCAGLVPRRARRVPRPAWPHAPVPRRVLAAVPRWRAEVRRPCRLVSRSLAVTTPRSMQKRDRHASGPGQSRGHVSPWLARTGRVGCQRVRMLSPARASIQTSASTTPAPSGRFGSIRAIWRAQPQWQGRVGTGRWSDDDKTSGFNAEPVLSGCRRSRRGRLASPLRLSGAKRERTDLGQSTITAAFGWTRRCWSSLCWINAETVHIARYIGQG